MGTRLGLNGLPTFAYGGVSGGREPVQERVLMALNDIKHSGLQNFLSTSGSVGDMENAYLQSLTGLTGSTRDLWQAYWASLGITSQSYNDAAYEWLGGLGFSGTLVERWRGYWQAGLLIQEALVDLNGDNITTTAGAVTEWANAGTGGASYDLDTVVGTGANLKRHPSGSALLYAGNNHLSAPDTAAAPTDDITVICYVFADDYSPASYETIASKWNTTGNQRSFQFGISATDRLSLFLSGDGIEQIEATSSVSPSLTDGAGYWLRATHDNSANQTTFYYSTDAQTAELSAISWTQVGAAVSHTVAGVFDSTAELNIGCINSDGTNDFNGAVARSYIIAGTDPTATPAISFDARDYVSGSTLSTDGTTWTLNGNTFIQNTGRDVVHTIGSAGLETSAGQTITSPGTVLGVFRLTNPSSGSGILVGARSVGTSRWLLGVDPGPVWQLFQGGTQITFGTADDEWHVWTGQFNGNATTKLTVSGEGSVTGNAGGQDWDAMTLFNNFPAGEGAEAACARLLVFNRALTDAEASALETHLKAYAGIAA